MRRTQISQPLIATLLATTFAGSLIVNSASAAISHQARLTSARFQSQLGQQPPPPPHCNKPSRCSRHEDARGGDDEHRPPPPCKQKHCSRGGPDPSVSVTLADPPSSTKPAVIRTHGTRAYPQGVAVDVWPSAHSKQGIRPGDTVTVDVDDLGDVAITVIAGSGWYRTRFNPAMVLVRPHGYRHLQALNSHGWSSLVGNRVSKSGLYRWRP